ncbi:MAG: LacI family DNA-binding transcriptional regulator [Leucobacter sp.]
MTIIDIAAELGVSKTTVSAALHGNGRVSKAMQQRVAEAAERLGYVSNRAAQKLRSRQAQSVGLHLFANSQALGFYMEFAFGVIDVAAAHGLDLLLLTETEAQTRNRSLAADGLLVLDPTADDQFIEYASKTRIPIVAVGPVSPNQQPLIRGQIYCRQDLMTPILLDRLAAAGARRPAVITLDHQIECVWITEAVDAYLEWTAMRGIEPRVIRSSFPSGPDEADDAVDRLVSEADIDSVLVVQQGLAASVSKLYRARTGTPLLTAALAADPASESDLDHLFAVDLNAREYGRRAAQLLVEVMQDGSKRESPVFHREVSLLSRGRTPIPLFSR